VSTYQLDDADVEAWRAGSADAAGRVLIELKKQLPIPVPTKIGAVVETTNHTAQISIGTFLRWAMDTQNAEPWVCVGDQSLGTYRSDDIGRITEVLSEGVDL
jgi:hypothetical protein